MLRFNGAAVTGIAARLTPARANAANIAVFIAHLLSKQGLLNALSDTLSHPGLRYNATGAMKRSFQSSRCRSRLLSDILMVAQTAARLS